VPATIIQRATHAAKAKAWLPRLTGISSPGRWPPTLNTLIKKLSDFEAPRDDELSLTLSLPINSRACFPRNGIA
jgi:hypothetical protein